MKTDNEMIGLFPIPVMASHIGREFTHDEKDFMLKLPTKLNMGNVTSVDKNVLDYDELKGIRDFVQSKIEDYFQNIICPTTDTSIYITQSWLNYTSKNQFHHKHNHSNSYLSGVIYIDTHPSEDKIHFINPVYNLFPLYMNSIEYHDFNAMDWWLPVYTGRILLFPSHLTHYVSNLQTDTQRISLAFNTFLRGEIGDIEAAAGMTLP